ncbi:MAG: 1-acyl-sn-glycerol-3-phosphate acyltransferase [Spirochaetes bacterium]|nr:1-acyl-sn-glycerol-3-phosphate acyltransferase [Spirochaetota bacterium]
MPKLLNFLFNIKVHGKEKIPNNGPYIVASNHFSNWDPPILYYALYPIIPITMAKKELFKYFPINIILKSLYSFPIDRKNFKTSSLKLVKKLIEEKKVLLMFPEGTRTKGKDLSKIKIKPGTIYIALQENIPIVPVHIEWPANCTKTFLKRLSVNIYFKNPIFFSNYYKNSQQNSKENLSIKKNNSSIEELCNILLNEIRNK